MEKNYEHRDQMQEFCVLPGSFQHAVLKTHLQFQREIFADNIEYLLREIPVKVECCLYIVISNLYGKKISIFSMSACQVHVIYAYMNQCLFFNIVAMRKSCSSKCSLRNTLYSTLETSSVPILNYQNFDLCFIRCIVVTKTANLSDCDQSNME